MESTTALGLFAKSTACARLIKHKWNSDFTESCHAMECCENCHIQKMSLFATKFCTA